MFEFAQCNQKRSFLLAPLFARIPFHLALRRISFFNPPSLPASLTSSLGSSHIHFTTATKMVAYELKSQGSVTAHAEGPTSVQDRDNLQLQRLGKKPVLKVCDRISTL